MIKHLSFHWWILLILVLIYVVLFCLSNIACLVVLFPRTKAKERLDILNNSVTNIDADCTSGNFDKLLKETDSHFNEIIKAHIQENLFILRKKNKYCKFILPLSILMSVILFTLILLLFIF